MEALAKLRASFLAQQKALAAQRSAIDAQEAALLECLEGLGGLEAALAAPPIPTEKASPLVLRLKEADEHMHQSFGWPRGALKRARFEGRYATAFAKEGNGSSPVYVNVDLLVQLSMGRILGVA